MQTRYFVKQIEARTYSIRDKRDKKVYLLCINPVFTSSANNQFIVAEVQQDDDFYCTFIKEVLSFKWWTSCWAQVEQTIREFLTYLHNDGDISNPIGHTLLVGHMLHSGLIVSSPLAPMEIH